MLLREVSTDCAVLRIAPDPHRDAVAERRRWISGNRAALRRLFVILLDNAIKYSPAGAGVRLALTGEA